MTTDWNPKLVATVRRLHVDDGLSSSQIGARLGLSKGAVLGKMQRIGLRGPAPAPVISTVAPTPSRPAHLARHHIDWSQLDDELRDLRDEGLGPKACAPILGVAEGSIRKRVKALNLPNLQGGPRRGVPTGRVLSQAAQSKLHVARVASNAYAKVSASLHGHAVSAATRAKMSAAAIRRHAVSVPAC